MNILSAEMLSHFTQFVLRIKLFKKQQNVLVLLFSDDPPETLYITSGPLRAVDIEPYWFECTEYS